LSLWIKALRSLHFAQQQVLQTGNQVESQRNDALNYLRWLSPNAAQSADQRLA
jgi:hypothetical protein